MFFAFEGPETTYPLDARLFFDPCDHICPSCGISPTDPAHIPDNGCAGCDLLFCDRCFAETGVSLWDGESEEGGIWTCDDCFVNAALDRPD